ncbi:MAG: sugar kinase [Silicimonas sp.]|nr:sugar kinase [Silicimonas sp.]
MSADILGIGEALIEMVKLPDPIDGRPAYVQGFGGDTSTAIVAAARQGARTGYISALGDDMFGEAVRDLWAREGVDHTHVLTRDGDPTGVCFIDPDPAGRRFTYARRGSAASLYGLRDLPENAIASARVLHFSGVTLAISETMRAAALRAAGIARAHGTLVSLDLNHRPRLWSDDLAREVLAGVPADIVFPSDDEAAVLLGLTDPEAIADHYLAKAAQVVVLKQGAKGAFIATPDQRFNVPAAHSTPVDSSGAGDSFAGAFLAYWLETGDIRLAATRAAQVAAGTVSGLGAVEPIPRRDEIVGAD